MLLSFHLRELLIIKWLSWTSAFVLYWRYLATARVWTDIELKSFLSGHIWTFAPGPNVSQLLVRICVSVISGLKLCSRIAWQIFIWHCLCLHFVSPRQCLHVVLVVWEAKWRDVDPEFFLSLFVASYSEMNTFSYTFSLCHSFGLVLALFLLLWFQEKIFFCNVLSKLVPMEKRMRCKE